MKKRFNSIVFCSLLVLLLTGCGGGSKSDKNIDTPTNNTSNTNSSNNPSNVTNPQTTADGNSLASNITMTGLVVDAYIKGATVFIDVNNNRKLDANEPSATTDEQGYFNFNKVTGVDYCKSGDKKYCLDTSSLQPGQIIVSSGGTDTVTKRPILGLVLTKIPDNYALQNNQKVVISPLSSVAAYMSSEQEKNLLSALGLKSSEELLSLDPLAFDSNNQNNATQKSQLRILTKIQNTVQAITAGLSSGNTDDAAQLNSLIYEVVATNIDRFANDLVRKESLPDNQSNKSVDSLLDEFLTKVNEVGSTIGLSDKAVQNAKALSSGGENDNRKALLDNIVALDKATETVFEKTTITTTQSAETILFRVELVGEQVNATPFNTKQVSNAVTVATSDELANALATQDQQTTAETQTTVNFNTLTTKVAVDTTIKASDVANLVETSKVTELLPNQQDTTAPVISLSGANPLIILQGRTYSDPGSSVTDNLDTGLVASVSGMVDTATAGAYAVSYNASDSAGNKATTITRSVIVLGAPTITMVFGIKQIQLSWLPVIGADHYRISVNPDGSSGFSIVTGAESVTSNSFAIDIPVHFTDWMNAQYRVEACNADNSVCAGAEKALTVLDSIASIGYIKASNTDASDYFGFTVALSDDGNTLAVGAYQEDSAATTVNGDQADNTLTNSGAVYVFNRNSGLWTQQAYLKSPNSGRFGSSVSLSSNGNVLVVGSPQSLVGGAAFVFKRTGSAWAQDAQITDINIASNDNFGSAVSISNDGSRLAISAPSDDRDLLGNAGAAANSGAVYIFVDTAGGWNREAYLKASNSEAGDSFGGGNGLAGTHSALALSGDGNTLVVGAMFEAGSTTGVIADVLSINLADNASAKSGAAYVFSRSGAGVWMQQAYIKSSNPETFDYFGQSVTISDDGNILAVGAPYEDSAATGIGGLQTDNSAASSGAAYLFTRDLAGIWTQSAYVKSSNTEATDHFGWAISLSGNGGVLMVGARGESSNAVSINGDQTNNSLGGSGTAEGAAGAVYAFVNNGGSWSQTSYIKASNTGLKDGFGNAVSQSTDGSTIAVGAFAEDSASSGVSGSQADNTAADAGAVYLY